MRRDALRGQVPKTWLVRWLLLSAKLSTAGGAAAAMECWASAEG